MRKSVLFGVALLAGISVAIPTAAAGAVPAPPSLAVDHVRPTAQAPTQTFTAYSKLGTDPAGPSIPLHFTWSAGSDDATPTGQLEYRLQRAVNGGDFETVWDRARSRSTRQMSCPLSLPRGRPDPCKTPDSSYRYRVQARDLGGNVSPFATAPAFIPRVRQEYDPALTWAGSWLDRSNQNAYGNGLRYSTSLGARVRTSFTSATGVAAIMPVTGSLAEPRICLFQATSEIACQDIDLSRPEGGARRLVFVRDGLDPRLNYSLRIEATLGQIELDAVVIDD